MCINSECIIVFKEISESHSVILKYFPECVKKKKKEEKNMICVIGEIRHR